ncbi:MAG TPA: DUF309 domain-containing protein [Nitratifractor sp.]|nr:DUF309 domain-containing protein [Nitratifractor sp.]
MLAISDYKELLLQQKFYEAHEKLEEYWFPRRKEKSRGVLIVKGFINAAVAFELKKRGRQESALKVWKTYKKFSLLIESDENDFIELKEFVEDYAKKYLF